MIPAKFSAALFLLALAVSGCQGEAPSAQQTPSLTAPSTAPVPSPTPSPSPSVLTKGQAGQRYLALVRDSNKVAATLQKYLQGTGQALERAELMKARSLTATLADSNRRFTLALQAERWPTDVALVVDDLTKAAVASQGHLRAMAEAETATAYVANYESYIKSEDSSAGAAELMRQKLGLAERGAS